MTLQCSEMTCEETAEHRKQASHIEDESAHSAPHISVGRCIVDRYLTVPF